MFSKPRPCDRDKMMTTIVEYYIVTRFEIPLSYILFFCSSYHGTLLFFFRLLSKGKTFMQI